MNSLQKTDERTNDDPVYVPLQLDPRRRRRRGLSLLVGLYGDRVRVPVLQRGAPHAPRNSFGLEARASGAWAEKAIPRGVVKFVGTDTVFFGTT